MPLLLWSRLPVPFPLPLDEASLIEDADLRRYSIFTIRRRHDTQRAGWDGRGLTRAEGSERDNPEQIGAAGDHGTRGMAGAKLSVAAHSVQVLRRV
jgi:hypothetical protein